MRLLVTIVLLMLGGCFATTEVLVKPEVIQGPERVVVQRCIDAAAIPAPPKSNMRPGTDAGQLAAGAVLDLQALDAFVARLLALLHGCAK